MNLQRVSLRKFALFKSVNGSPKKGTLYKEGQKINPTLLRFAAEADGIIKRLNTPSIHKRQTTSSSLMSNYYLFNLLLPRFEARAVYPQLYYKDGDLISTKRVREIMEPICNQANQAMLNQIKESKIPPKSRLMLGVQSSFDDSALALVTLEGKVINQKSKNMLREATLKGGITPTDGARHHFLSLPKLYEELVQEGSKLVEQQIEAIAVTVGPGQEHSLNEGIRFAQNLGRKLGIPVYPVNHLEAHCLVPRMSRGGTRPKFPFISCLATGTSTDLILHKDLGCNLIYGFSLDQALGAALDGVSRDLFSHPVFKDPKARRDFIALQRGRITQEDLNFFDDELIHGGKRLQELAKYGSIFESTHVPNTQSVQLDLSFSGLHAFNYKEIYETRESVPKHKRTYSQVSIQHLANLAATIQFKAFAQVQRKLWKLLDWISMESAFNNMVKEVVLAGGVARNQSFRKYINEVCQAHGKELVIPEPELCSDNAAMIAWAGWELLARNKQANIVVSLELQQNQKIRGIHKMPVGPLARIPVLRRGYLSPDEIKKKQKKKD